MNKMSEASAIRIVEIIEGDRDVLSGFVAEYEGVRYVYVSEESELLMDEAREIGYAPGRPSTQVLSRLLEEHLRQETLH